MVLLRILIPKPRKEESNMPNHLQTEKSPYLLQHSDNPVDWFPWCDEAFAKARSENKPVFLSIGYSTCHWCHVMAHESFEDPEIAALLNRGFVSVKVDREERPDIDAVYMSVCQALTGSGGWPLTVIMTPEQKPFFAGTYFPKHSMYGRTGLYELLLQIEERWRTDPGKMIQAGDTITAYLRAPETAPGQPSDRLLRQGVFLLKKSFDSVWGGFGRAPKFPTPHNLLFLLRFSALTQDKKALEMAEQTLAAMAHGGIFDQIGGGFSRYSTDERWLAPHFEKMLYDNALLTCAYLEAFRLTADPFYRSVARLTISYVLRELTGPDGGFCCGQDADSDGVEGKYYVFTPGEVCSVLGPKDGRRFCEWFHITEEGNFEGQSIPNRIGGDRLRSPEIETLCRKMLAYRQNRTSLHRDDKVLTSWNSMMAAALAKASFVCGDPFYLNIARSTVLFVETKLSTPDGRLLVRYRDGEAAFAGQLDDYAYYCAALLEMYQATWETGYLKLAVRYAEQMVRRFSCGENGGFYLYADDAQQLISRPVETYDGAIPSGNSVAGHVLTTLAALTGEEMWRKERDRQLGFLAAAAANAPSAHCHALSAMCSVLYPSAELVCVSAEAEMPEEAREFLRTGCYPGLTVLFKNRENQEQLGELAPFTGAYPVPETGTRYYLCRQSSCSEPVEEISELKKLL